MTKKLLVIISLLFLSLAVSAQKEIKLHKKEQKQKPIKSFAERTDKVEKVEIEGNDSIQVYARQEKSKTITSGSFSGLSYNVFSYVIVFPNGKEVLLPEEEYFNGVSGNYLLTGNVDFDKDEQEFHVYKINGNSLNKINSLKFNSVEIVGRLINDILIVSDFIEGYGEKLLFYDIKSLKLLNSFSPFNKGFSFQNFYGNGSEIFLFFSSFENPGQHKLVVFNNKGLAVREKTLYRDHFFAAKLGIVRNFYLVEGMGVLMAFGENFELLWEKKIYLPYYEFEMGNDNLYLVADREIVCVDLKSGNIEWSIPYSDGSFTKSGDKIIEKRIVGIKENPRDNSLVLLIGKTTRGFSIENEIIYESELHIIDSKGAVKSKKSLWAESKKGSIVSNNGNMLLINQGDIYEIIY